MIREATREDAALLRELGARTFHDAFAAFNTPENMQAYMATAFAPARIAEELADPAARFLIAEAEGAAAGYAKLAANAPPPCVQGAPAIELVRFYVDRRFHGGGIAHALMRFCVDRAAADGFASMFLSVWERNPRAIAFYRKWGFETVGGQIFQLGDDPQNDLLMERTI
ncbi:MAG: GNAT family N-acetyltransferase [Blastocatellia bacterium]|nr:GNAT family N-acetyltransferase [Blastocatellia bacterium]